jgi:hypothetical protein
MGLFSGWFSDDEEEVSEEEQRALDYYEKHGKVPKFKDGSWALDYIPSSLNNIDRQQWMLQTDGQLQVKK